jgi:hypothetical protein
LLEKAIFMSLVSALAAPAASTTVQAASAATAVVRSIWFPPAEWSSLDVSRALRSEPIY